MKGLTERHRRFAELIAQGETGRAAYEAAGYRARGEPAANGASRLQKHPAVAAYISELRASAATRGRQETLLTLQRKLDFLARAVLTGAGQIQADDPLCQSYKELAGGKTEIKLPCKLRALELHAKLSGEFTERLTLDPGDTLTALLNDIRHPSPPTTLEESPEEP